MAILTAKMAFFKTDAQWPVAKTTSLLVVFVTGR